ncbi:MAG: GNAT family N-acetyltransferase [Actinomycetota bacterium]
MEDLQTPRLVLEPWDETRLEEWVALASDPAMTRWIGSGDAWSRARSERQFRLMLDHWRDHGFGWRSALDRESRAWLGFVGLNHVTPNDVELGADDVEIGWWLKSVVWGRGLASEGALALRDEAFESVKLDRIVSRHHASNPASGRVMEKIGMRFERDATGGQGEPVRIYVLDRARWLSLPHN